MQKVTKLYSSYTSIAGVHMRTRTSPYHNLQQQQRLNLRLHEEEASR